MRPCPPPLFPPFEPLESCLLLRGSSLSSGLNFQAPRIVVRGGGKGAGFDPFAAVAGAVCDGAAVIGPGGACPGVTSPARRPNAPNPVRTVSLKKQMAFTLDPLFGQTTLLWCHPKSGKSSPLLAADNSLR